LEAVFSAVETKSKTPIIIFEEFSLKRHNVYL